MIKFDNVTFRSEGERVKTWCDKERGGGGGREWGGVNTILKHTFFPFLMKPFGETSNFYCIDIFSYIMRLGHDCDISTVFTDTSNGFLQIY